MGVGQHRQVETAEGDGPDVGPVGVGHDQQLHPLTAEVDQVVVEAGDDGPQPGTCSG